jgi:hypothetical protein
LTVSLIFSGPLVEPALSRDLLDAYEMLKTGTLYRQYAKQNPKESTRVDAYWYGGAATTAATPTGQALLSWAGVHRGA